MFSGESESDVGLNFRRPAPALRLYPFRWGHLS